MARIFVAAFLLGLVLNAAPGPVFAETLRRGLRGGFRAGLAVQVGSLVGDALWAVLGLLGVGLLLRVEAVRLPVGIAGTLYLGWLAWDAWRAADRELIVDGSSSVAEPSGVALRSGVLLSVTNPQNVAYWAAIGSALGALGVQEPTAADYAVYLGGFMAASITWSFACAAAVSLFARRARPGWVRITYRACAIAFLALALATLRDLCSGSRPPAWPMRAVPAPTAGQILGGFMPASAPGPGPWWSYRICSSSTSNTSRPPGRPPPGFSP